MVTVTQPPTPCLRPAVDQTPQTHSAHYTLRMLEIYIRPTCFKPPARSEEEHPPCVNVGVRGPFEHDNGPAQWATPYSRVMLSTQCTQKKTPQPSLHMSSKPTAHFHQANYNSVQQITQSM